MWCRTLGSHEYTEVIFPHKMNFSDSVTSKIFIYLFIYSFIHWHIQWPFYTNISVNWKCFSQIDSLLHMNWQACKSINGLARWLPNVSACRRLNTDWHRYFHLWRHWCHGTRVRMWDMPYINNVRAAGRRLLLFQFSMNRHTLREMATQWLEKW